MTGRDPDEAYRAATPLELLFDLCFVVAVAQAAASLHHELAVGQVGHAVVSFLIVFFTIWWPWVNFTWFSSAYDTDDVLYRLATFVQITGVLIVTAGVASAFESMDFRIMVVGYIVMRIALVGQWLRVAREDPERRRTALRFASSIALLQVGWAVRLAMPAPIGLVAFLAFGVLELLIPIWAESSGSPTPWHARHVTERYGLFTIIVIGECVLAATTAVQATFTASGLSPQLLSVAAGGLFLVFGLWWMYFKDTAALRPHASLRAGIAWGYGHYVIFAAVAALGAGLQLAVETTQHGVSTAPELAAAAVAIPVAAYLIAVAVLHARTNFASGIFSRAGLAAILVLLAALATPWIGVSLGVLAIGLVVAGLIAIHVATAYRAERTAPATAAADVGRDLSAG